MPALKSQNEKGFTLIEVIASILLITIILISLFSLLVQSNKTTNSSKNIVDATYVAQVEMEKIFSERKVSTLSDVVANRSSPWLDYSVPTAADKTAASQSCSPSVDFFSSSHTFEKTDADFSYKLTIKPHCKDKNLANVIVEVYEESTLKSVMENIYTWK
ncbi:MAG: prepilin-type N-terminal cleavage/methylation domain-containing protein [Lysinibacillus sp.]